MKTKSLGYLLKEGIKNIWSNRTMSIASIGVLVSCLLLTGAAVVFSYNINSAMKTIEGTNSVRVYMAQNLPTLSAIKVGEEIKKLDNIKTCEFVPKDEAIQQYMNILGDKDGTMLQGMTGKENPLPDAFKVSFKDLSKYKDTAAQIKKIPGVATINDYSDVAAKLTRLDKVITMAGFWIILLLSLVSLFIISNTIRVTMFSRRVEISIMKSVGATNWFIRVPFIVEGVIIGLLSGALSSFLLFLIYDKMVGSITSITLFSPVDISPMAGSILLAFMLAGTLFGALGGVISISKYLKKEGGEIVGW
ncbi:permease-like cell division protein FtsX [Caproiciproducens galactitolivorans]|uniref:Cell division protein FtsX n=1 Tax=Caproiciproducens galactitolivorans TaxID=642589 RepID=A0ABT4BVZ5_9FIRM|nr:permease-like cell division protein FtsX [Caproiciproducens galactitolivorans]MCY1715068.1 permease-like cell division protein FtsX [Caproiciproducens galactitolivorans]